MENCNLQHVVVGTLRYNDRGLAHRRPDISAGKILFYVIAEAEKIPDERSIVARLLLPLAVGTGLPLHACDTCKFREKAEKRRKSGEMQWEGILEGNFSASVDEY